MSVKEEILLDYLEVSSAYQSQAIPSSDKFTFFSKLTGIPQVWTLGTNGEPEQFIETNDRVMSVFHSPTGEHTVVGVDGNGNEKQQLYLVGENGQGIETLVESPEHFHYVGGWSPDGKYLSYSSNRRHPGYFDVFVINIETKETKNIFSYDANCIPLNWLDNENLLISMKETNIDSAIYGININSKEKFRIGNENILARYEAIIMGNEADKGYVLTDSEEETLHLCSFSLSSPEKLDNLLHWKHWDIEEIAKSPNGVYLAFTLNEGGISKLGIYYPSDNSSELLDLLPKGYINSISWLSNEEFIFTLKTPINPGDIWKYNMVKKEASRLTYIGHSESVGHFWKEPKLCTYISFDGLEVPYFFYNQEENDRKPAVIYVHGGPEGQTRAEYNPVMQYLVHQGFAVAAPNIRGSNGYGRTYLKLDDADKRMDSVEDLAWLAKDLVSSNNVDAEKVGIMGRSYGGFMVLAALTHYPELWAAGVNIVGISNLKTFLLNTGEWRRYLRESEYGSLEKYSDYFDEIAPLNLSHRITAPLLVFHGRNDTRVPVSEAEQLVNDMRLRKQKVEFTVFEDEGHQTEKIENHVTMHTKTVEFFSNYLK